MDVRAWLVCLLLLEQWYQRSHYSGAIFISQEGDFSQRGIPPSHDKIRQPAQSNPDMHLIRSQLGVQATPYSLSLSPDDYHSNLPKPKHLRTSQLMKLLGPSYDPFWMSVKDPRGRNPGLEKLSTLNLDLAKRTARFRKKLLQETDKLDLSKWLPLLSSKDGITHNLSQSVIRHLRQRLVDSATCYLTSSWVDMGPIFWPRWVRHTYCDLTQAGCSWPPGMTCGPAQVTHIKLLAWHCWVNGTQSLNPGRPLKKCVWRQIPYPVVAVCKCGC